MTQVPHQIVTATPKPDHADRVHEVTGLLQGGKTRQQIIEYGMDEWGIGQRMAQKYVQKATQRITEEALREERVFGLRLAEQQRDRLFSVALQAMENPNTDAAKIIALTKLVNALNRLLDRRDAVAVTLHEYVEQRKLETDALHSLNGNGVPGQTDNCNQQESTSEKEPSLPKTLLPEAPQRPQPSLKPNQTQIARAKALLTGALRPRPKTAPIRRGDA